MWADACPIMILSEASVESLSCNYNEELTALRFRPNIVVTGCEPYSEVY